MSSPFTMAGPEFLRLFLIAGLASMVWVHVARRVLAGPAPTVADLDGHRTLDPFQLAYLAGGLTRAIEAAVAELVHRGLVAVHDGRLVRTGASPGKLLVDDHAFRGIVVDAPVDGLPGRALAAIGADGRTFGSLHARLEAEEAALQQPLIAAGLRHAPEARVVRGALALAPGVIVTAIGAIKLIRGIALDRPVGILLLLLAVAVTVLWVTAPFAPTTRRGRAVLVGARARLEGLRATAAAAPEQLSPGDQALAYAVFGPVALAGAAAGLTTVFAPPPAAAAASGSGCGAYTCSSSDSSSSSSSSCSSGCSGGGGCGGCGGCS